MNQGYPPGGQPPGYPPAGQPPGYPPGGQPPGYGGGFAPPGGYGVGLPPGVNPSFGGPGGGAQQEQMGIVSLVLGALSVFFAFCCGPVGVILGIVGVVLGIVSISRINQEPQRYSGKGLAIAGIVASAFGPILYIIIFIFSFGISFLGAMGGP